MNIYIASRYSRRREMCGYRDELVAVGHTVTSRWLDGTHEFTEMLSVTAAFEHRRQFSQEDLDDLQQAEVVINFTEPENTDKRAGRGGRHVEFGVALGLNLSATRHGYKGEFRLVVVGHRENVFHCLPCVEFYKTWEEAKNAIVPMEELL